MNNRMTVCAGITLCALPMYPAEAGNLPAKKGSERPNILFILSDDHTSQSWGIYGGILQDYVKNDNIKRLAREGCVLDNCFCTNSLSVPSRATIITGAYSHRNGVYTLKDRIAEGTDNIAKHLQAGGYQTALFGKWHLKTKPEGFDDFAVLHGQGVYFDPIFKTPQNWVETKSGDPSEGFSTDLIAGKTMDWIRNRDKSKPFLACCHFKATHEPWLFPERLRHLYDGVVFPEPETLLDSASARSGRTFEGQKLEILGECWENSAQGKNDYPELPFSTEGMDPDQARKAIYQKFVRDYLRCGAAVDENIGKLLDLLDEEGLAENTVVIYVADQGYFMGEHGFFDKRIMYEEPLRMPFVIRYPKEIPAGTRNQDMILNVDFASLLADYGEVDAPELAQGCSFRSNLQGRTPKAWRESMYYRYWTQFHDRPAHMGVRTERYKLLFFYGDRLDMTGSEDVCNEPSWEFYDLKEDPHENHNAYGDPKYAGEIRRLKKKLLRLRQEYEDTDESRPRMKEIMDEHFW